MNTGRRGPQLEVRQRTLAVWGCGGRDSAGSLLRPSREHWQQRGPAGTTGSVGSGLRSGREHWKCWTAVDEEKEEEEEEEKMN